MNSIIQYCQKNRYNFEYILTQKMHRYLQACIENLKTKVKVSR